MLNGAVWCQVGGHRDLVVDLGDGDTPSKLLQNPTLEVRKVDMVAVAAFEEASAAVGTFAGTFVEEASVEVSAAIEAGSEVAVASAIKEVAASVDDKEGFKAVLHRPMHLADQVEGVGMVAATMIEGMGTAEEVGEINEVEQEATKTLLEDEIVGMKNAIVTETETETARATATANEIESLVSLASLATDMGAADEMTTTDQESGTTTTMGTTTLDNDEGIEGLFRPSGVPCSILVTVGWWVCILRFVFKPYFEATFSSTRLGKKPEIELAEPEVDRLRAKDITGH